MKLKKILPILTISALPISAVSFASCGPENKFLATLSWDFVKDHEYESHIGPKSKDYAYTTDDGIVQYLTDVKGNPMILIDDIMLHESILYDRDKASYGDRLIGYKDELHLIDVDVDRHTISFSYVQEKEIAPSVNSNVFLDKTITSFKYLNIPYISRFTFEPSSGQQFIKHALPRWEFIPEFINYRTSKGELKEYFKSINDWSLQGTITHDDSSNDIISYDFNRDNIDSITDIQFAHLVNDAFYDLWSKYYEEVGVAPDFDANYETTGSVVWTADRQLKYPNSYVLHIDMNKFKGTIGSGWKLYAHKINGKHNDDIPLVYNCVGSIGGKYFETTAAAQGTVTSYLNITSTDIIDLVIMPARDSGMEEQDVVQFVFTPSAE